MTRRSLRLRLVLAAALSILVSLVIGGIGLAALFERHVIRRAEIEIDTHLRQIAGEVAFSSEGTLELSRSPSDARFDIPLSGIYWQIEDDRTGARIRSRSLWDHVIALPSGDEGREATHRYVLPGPDGGQLLVGERHVKYDEDGREHELKIAVAVDRRDITNARQQFVTDVTLSLMLLAGVLIVAAWSQIAIGLRPLEAVRRSVVAVRAGRQSRLEVDEPAEVMPLVAEVNNLLDAQAEAITRARSRAADFAHGMKTPLTALTSLSERLRDKQEAGIADEIEAIATDMLRHTNWELSKARLQSAGHSHPPRVMVRDVIERVVRTLSIGPKGQALAWHTEIPADAAINMPIEDVAELFGTLLDNAVKWAATEVRVLAETPDGLKITIEDDGPGVTPELLQRLGRRGERLDETVEGTGLGLAIATEIIEAYGGSLVLGNRQPHGFKVTVRQPVRG